jgi:hypothetical protein
MCLYSGLEKLLTWNRFGSRFDGLPEQERESGTLLFAMQKLLNGRSLLAGDDHSGSLACLATRFALEFNEDPESRMLSCTQVERHMRLCLAATTGFERLVTCSASEPLLAEAAFEILRTSETSVVNHLANHSDLYCVDRERRGELVAALIIMQARDASLPLAIPQRKWVCVTEFMEALLPPSAYANLLESHPTFCRNNEDHPFSTIFQDYRLWFNHIIRVEDSQVIKADSLWKYVTRGAMVVCKNNQYAIDIILPVCRMHGNLSRQTITAIYIQVKNAKSYTLKIKNPLFDAMDPFTLGLHNDNPLGPLPIIRLVFALGSPRAGVSFRPPCRTTNGDDFTTFDIWCAGLSTETFRQIGDDLESYRILLDRSLQPNDVFELKETKYKSLSNDTKAERGRLRRNMAPLVMFSGHDGIHE